MEQWEAHSMLNLAIELARKDSAALQNQLHTSVNVVAGGKIVVLPSAHHQHAVSLYIIADLGMDCTASDTCIVARPGPVSHTWDLTVGTTEFAVVVET